MAAVVWLAAQLIVVLAIVWHWATTGVDGILSQRATPNGFLITQVRPGAAADLAGLRVGDLIVDRDGVSATDRQAYWTMRRIGESEQPVVFSIVRSGAAPGTPPDEVGLRLTPTISIPDQLALLAVLTLFNVFTPAIAAIVLWARPRDFSARLFGLSVLGFAPYPLLFMWDKAVGQTLDPQWHWYAVFVCGRLSLLARLHLFLSFPERHPWLARLERLGPTWLRRLGGGVGLLYALPMGLSVLTLSRLFPEPLAFSSLETPNPDATVEVNNVGLVLSALLLFAVVDGYRRAARPAARGAVVWLLFASIVSAALTVWTLNSLNALIGIDVQPVTDPIRWSATLVATSAIGLALVRYRLFEVSPFVRTALLYPLALGILIGGYDLIAGILGRIAVMLLGPEIGTNPLLAAVPLLIVVALLRPLRSRFQGVLERSLYRARRARSQFLDEATATFDRARPLDQVAALLTVRAVERLNLTGAWLVGNEPLIGAPPAPAPVESLVDSLVGLAGPVALVSSGQVAAMTAQTLVADTAPLERWYQVGARLLIPLSVPAAPGAESGSVTALAGAWVIGARRSDESFDDDDIAVFAHIGRLAGFQLDYARLAAAVAQHEIPAAAVAPPNEATATT